MRQVKLINPNATEDQIQECKEDPQKIQELMSAQMFGNAHMTLVNKATDIEEKYKDIKKLEKVWDTFSLRLTLFLEYVRALANAVGSSCVGDDLRRID